MVNLVKPGPRLSYIASLIDCQARLADIGTDHAYLPIVLCQQGKIERAVAIDINQGPYQTALTMVQNHELTEKIEVRLGNGLQPLELGEIDTISIAGLGGNTILEILLARPDILAEVSDLILQPQGLESKVRHTLLKEGWLLREEQLVEEEGRIYIVMAFSRKAGYSKQELLKNEEQWLERIIPAGNYREPTGKELALCLNGRRETEIARSLFWRIGPLILQNPNQLLSKLIQKLIEELSYREEQMRKSASLEVQIRRQETLLQLSFLETLDSAIHNS